MKIQATTPSKDELIGIAIILIIFTLGIVVGRIL